MKKILFGSAGAALALALMGVSVVSIDVVERSMRAGSYTGLTADRVTSNKVTRSLGKQFDYDFAKIGGRVDTKSCDETPYVTMTGAKAGDPCFAGAFGGVDAGSPLTTETWLNCYVPTTDKVAWRLCGVWVDGGFTDTADAGYYARILSAQ